MLNRWQGNTGKVERIFEPGSSLSPPPTAPRMPPVSPDPVLPTQNGVLENISRLLPGLREPLDSEDILLLLILYLMYRESGDSELLIIMGAMFLL